MCDYSLDAVESRAAEVGDGLRLVPFSGGSTGFSNGAMLTCVPAGAKLTLTGISKEVRDIYELPDMSIEEIKGEMVRGDLVWIDMRNSGWERHDVNHADGIQFENGKRVPLWAIAHAWQGAVFGYVYNYAIIAVVESIPGQRDMIQVLGIGDVPQDVVFDEVRPLVPAE